MYRVGIEPGAPSITRRAGSRVVARFNTLKSTLRTRGALDDAITTALATITAVDA